MWVPLQHTAISVALWTIFVRSQANQWQQTQTKRVTHIHLIPAAVAITLKKKEVFQKVKKNFRSNQHHWHRHRHRHRHCQHHHHYHYPCHHCHQRALWTRENKWANEYEFKFTCQGNKSKIKKRNTKNQVLYDENIPSILLLPKWIYISCLSRLCVYVHVYVHSYVYVEVKYVHKYVYSYVVYVFGNLLMYWHALSYKS